MYCGGTCTRKGLFGAICVVVAAVGVIVLVVTIGRQELTHGLAILAPWFRDLGPVRGSALFMVAYIGWLLLCGPSTVFNLLGGFFYPILRAVPLCFGACWIGSMLCFAIARGLKRARCSCCKGGMKTIPGSKSLDLLYAVRQLLATHEAKALILTRVALPIPLALKNYGFARFTEVRYTCFAWCILIGDLPATVLYCYMGHSFTSLVAILKGGHAPGPLSVVALTADIVGPILFSAVLIWATRRELRGMTKERTLRTEGEDAHATLLAAASDGMERGSYTDDSHAEYEDGRQRFVDG